MVSLHRKEIDHELPIKLTDFPEYSKNKWPFHQDALTMEAQLVCHISPPQNIHGRDCYCMNICLHHDLLCQLEQRQRYSPPVIYISYY